VNINLNLLLTSALLTGAAVGFWFVPRIWTTHCRHGGGFFVL